VDGQRGRLRAERRTSRATTTTTCPPMTIRFTSIACYSAHETAPYLSR